MGDSIFVPYIKAYSLFAAKGVLVHRLYIYNIYNIYNYSMLYTCTLYRTFMQIENILRQDLAGRFRRCQYDMQTELTEKERKYPQMFDLKTQVAFHGTLTKSLPSIGV